MDSALRDSTFWDKIADEYSRKPVELPEAFEKKIAHTRSLMSKDDTVLDVGCGTGSLALRLAPFAKAVHGLDLSPEMIRIARGKGREVGNVRFHVGAFDDSFQVFKAGGLDGLLAYSLLHLVEDRAAALAQIFTLLKPGGFFVSSTACLGESRVPYRPIIWVMQRLGRAPYVDFVRKDQLMEEMRACGFSDVREVFVGAKETTAFVSARKPLS